MSKKNPKITIYNGGFAVVRMEEEINPSAPGISEHSLENIASSIDTTSVKVTGVDSALKVIEQNFSYDLLDDRKLLEKCIGNNVKAYRMDGNRRGLVEGTLLSSSGRDIVMKTRDGLEIFQPSGYTLPKGISEGLILTPTLEWTLNCSKAGKQKIEVSYLTGGMTWQADYVAVLSEDESKMDLQGWVDLHNNSGQEFKKATVKLVAGEVQRDDLRGGSRGLAMAAAESAHTPQFEEESLADYHMYTLERKATLNNNEQKQIGLLSAENIGVEKTYQYQGGKVAVLFSFENSKKNNLGEPLPEGRMRFFKPDSSGQSQLIGEKRVYNTPLDEKVKDLHIGNAFDIVVDEKLLEQNQDADMHEHTMEYLVKNRKDEKVTVDIPLPIGPNTTIELRNQTSGLELVKEAANHYIVKVTVNPSSEVAAQIYTRQEAMKKTRGGSPTVAGRH